MACLPEDGEISLNQIYEFYDITPTLSQGLKYIHDLKLGDKTTNYKITDFYGQCRTLIFYYQQLAVSDPKKTEDSWIWSGHFEVIDDEGIDDEITVTFDYYLDVKDTYFSSAAGFYLDGSRSSNDFTIIASDPAIKSGTATATISIIDGEMDETLVVRMEFARGGLVNNQDVYGKVIITDITSTSGREYNTNFYYEGHWVGDS